MPRPRSLTQDQIAEAALAVLDEDGLAALSMRTVAHRLGRSTMGLYRYVRDRDELELLIVDRVLGAVDTTPPPADLPWPERVTLLVRRLRDEVGEHPAVAPLTIPHRHHSIGVLRWTESVLGVLTEAGVAGERRVIALRGLLGYVIGAIQLEHLGPLSGPGTSVMAGLSSEDFPNLAATARDAREVDRDREFFEGLGLLLAGLND